MIFETIIGFFGVEGAVLQVAGWLDVATQFIGVFAIIAAATKNTWDDRIAQVLSDVLNFLGANVGKAKNAVLIFALSSVLTLSSGCSTICPFLQGSFAGGLCQVEDPAPE